MKYRLSVSQAAIGQLRGLTKDLRRNIGARIEDLRDLEKAIVENDGKPLVPWSQAKALLDLD